MNTQGEGHVEILYLWEDFSLSAAEMPLSGSVAKTRSDVFSSTCPRFIAVKRNVNGRERVDTVYWLNSG
jgi:hypothetical protein